MTSRRLLTLAALLTASLSAQETSPGSPFDRRDANCDGKLSPEELPEPLRRVFVRVDGDGDGFISRAEAAALREARGAGRPGSGPAGPGRPGSGAGPGGPLPEGIKKIGDLDYAGTGNPRQALDLYLPEKRETAELLPVLVFIHGGGWQNGDKAGGGRRLADHVAGGKFAGVSVGYRLTDEARWPSQIHDCKAAIRWIKAHAAEHGLDPGRIAVWGTSAGGHLVAMLGTSGGVADLEGELGPHLEMDSRVACVVDFFGPTDMLTMGAGPGFERHNDPSSPESKLLGGPAPEHPETARSASPVTHVSADDPPFLIVHGTADAVVPHAQSTDLEKKLEEAGVSALLLSVEGGGHGKGFGPSVDRAVAAFLGRELLGEKHDLADGTVPAGE